MYTHTRCTFLTHACKDLHQSASIAIAAKNSLKLSWRGSPLCLPSRPAAGHGSWAPYRRSNINTGLSGMDKTREPVPLCLSASHLTGCSPHMQPHVTTPPRPEMCSLGDPTPALHPLWARKRWAIVSAQPAILQRWGRLQLGHWSISSGHCLLEQCCCELGSH